MLPKIVINVYCHNCGKICSANIKKIPREKSEEKIKDWLKCPYCIDCVKGRKIL